MAGERMVAGDALHESSLVFFHAGCSCPVLSGPNLRILRGPRTPLKKAGLFENSEGHPLASGITLPL